MLEQSGSQKVIVLNMEVNSGATSVISGVPEEISTHLLKHAMLVPLIPIADFVRLACHVFNI